MFYDDGLDLDAALVVLTMSGVADGTLLRFTILGNVNSHVRYIHFLRWAVLQGYLLRFAIRRGAAIGLGVVLQFSRQKAKQELARKQPKVDRDE